MTVLNLNAKRAARAAQRGEPLQMQLDDELFDLVGEIPISVISLATSGKFEDALRDMLAYPDEDWDRLMACRPSFTDVMDIVEFFGAQMGESLRSATSSKRTGPPLRSTGSGITEEISEPTFLADKRPANVPTRPAKKPAKKATPKPPRKPVPAKRTESARNGGQPRGRVGSVPVA